jgi:hypothetical protein
MGARTEQATLEFAAAYEVLPSLSIGLGASYANSVTTLTAEAASRVKAFKALLPA